MNGTDKLEDDAQEAMNAGRGLCRVLALGVLLAVAAVIGKDKGKEKEVGDERKAG
jgi:hypothetical protein